MPPLLGEDGDDLEKEFWSDLERLVPSYETFWQIHVVPLRGRGSIYLREGLDRDAELLAIFNYSAYTSLSRGYGKIQSKLEDFKYFDEIYSNLFRASELASKTVSHFCAIYESCLRRMLLIHTEKLNKIGTELKAYRNLLHGNMLATRRDSGRQRLIPVRDKLEQYGLWSVMRGSNNPDDFRSVESLLSSDLRALCSAMQSCWKEMCQKSSPLLENQTYRAMQRSGREISFNVRGAPAASGDYY